MRPAARDPCEGVPHVNVCLHEGVVRDLRPLRRFTLDGVPDLFVDRPVALEKLFSFRDLALLVAQEEEDLHDEGVEETIELGSSLLGRHCCAGGERRDTAVDGADRSMGQPVTGARSGDQRTDQNGRDKEQSLALVLDSSPWPPRALGDADGDITDEDRGEHNGNRVEQPLEGRVRAPLRGRD